MLNSASCEGTARAADALHTGRLQSLARRLAAGLENQRGAALDEASSGFASLLYGVLVKEMQKTLRDDEDAESPVTAGAYDFLGLYLPQAIARQESDPLTRAIRRYLEARLDTEPAAPAPGAAQKEDR